MRYLVFVFVCCAQTLFSDPFYYGNFRGLKLFGILHTKANINGSWVRLNAKFIHANTNFKLLALQDSCVIVKNLESQTKQKLCKGEPRFIKDR